MITVLTILCSVYIFIQILKEVKSLMPSFSGLKKCSVEDDAVETPKEESIKSRYDVDAFKRRIQYLKDQESADLYDVVIPPALDDFTGVEIVPLSAEIDIDKYVGRT